MSDTTAPQRLKILHLEDSEEDRYLVARVLKQSDLSCDIVYAKSREEFVLSLCREPFDLVLADQSLPGFDGISALDIVRERRPDLPFIFVTGSMGEEKAIDMMKHGATDYVLKDRFARLVPAVKRALEERRDKSERAAAEKQIKKQATLLDKASDAIILTDVNGRIAFWNKGAERIYGWAAAEVMGKNASELLSKDKSPRLSDARAKTMETGEWAGELIGFTKAGKVVITHSHWTRVDQDNGEPEGILSTNSDVTEKKQLEAQYLRAQRMESIGILAGGIAHDLNNVLSPILMVSQLLRMQIKDPEVAELLDTLENSANHGADLIRQILSFARGVGGENVEVQVGHLVRELQKMLKETLPRSIQLETKVARDLWTIRAVPAQLNQVLMNLCVNARDAMLDGGKITISVENVVIDEAYSRIHPDAKLGAHIAITVADTGGGIPPHVLQHIYDPFFTTKEPGKGTGLGLSTVKSIAKNHGGFVHVYSEPGKGTSFRTYFPALAGISVATLMKEQPPAIGRGNGECILVVDDEAPLLQTTKLILERHGYIVQTARDGAEGIATFVTHRDRVKVVVTDIMMPVMDGLAMIRTLLKLERGIKVIALSGLVEDHKVAELRAMGNIDLLQKPYSVEGLLLAIGKALMTGR